MIRNALLSRVVPLSTSWRNHYIYARVEISKELVNPLAHFPFQLGGAVEETVNVTAEQFSDRKE